MKTLQNSIKKWKREVVVKSSIVLLELEAALKEAAKVTWNNEEVMKAYNPEVVKKLKEMTGF